MDQQSLNRDVELAADGDCDAIQRLLVRYDPILRGKLTPRIGAEFASLIEIDDVLQEAYVSANAALATAKFNNAAGFYKWIEQIAANDLIDMQRRLTRPKRDIRRQMTENTRQSLIAIVERVTGGNPTPSRRLAKDEAVAAALSCLARLTDEQRTVIKARYFEQEPVTDLARRLDKSEPAIHALCYRGLLELRKHLGSISRFLTGL